jgi:ureidoglycolate dehydrogenase (NAD+)
VKVEADVVAREIARLSRSAGLDEDTSAALGFAVVRSHLARTPRVDVISEAIEDLASIAASPHRIVERRDTASMLAIDCAGLPALAALAVCFRQGVWAAGNRQISVVALANSGGMRTLDVWTRVLVRAGSVVLMSWNGGPYACVPYGSVVPYFGTNPMSYALPTNRDPVVGDFSTSEMAFMDLQAARRSGKDLSPLAGLDAAGRPTTDPHEVFVEPDSARLRPMGGGPKGSALMLLLEYLTGAFVGGAMGRTASPTFTAREFAGLILFIPDNLFRSSEAVRKDIGQLADDIRRSMPAHGFDSVRLPGDMPAMPLAGDTRVEVSPHAAALAGLVDPER